MRELDSSEQVVWPAWCYSGEITSDSSPQTASSPSLQISPSTASAHGESNKNRAKRKPIHNSLQYPVDKMLNERHKLLETTKKLFNNNLIVNNNNSSNMYYDKMKNDNNMNFIKNGELSPTGAKLSGISLLKNNNRLNSLSAKLNGSNGHENIKSERLSPNLNDLSIYRSRSVTPSSFSGTPPQAPSTQPNSLMNPNSSQHLPTHLLGNNGINGNSNGHAANGRSELNYSDMMRSLAAKYNNSNESATPKNSFMEPRKPREPNLPQAEKKQSAMSPPQVPNPNLLSSLFSSLPFSTNSIFNPMLDMSSTRALVVLARAAQEAELQKLLKDQEKSSSPTPAYPSTPFMNNYPSTSAQVPNLSNFGNFNPFPALSNLQALQQLSSRSPPAPNSFKSTSSTANDRQVASPLDLSASSTPPMAKRIKLSPSSPEASSATPHRQNSPNNVSTTNNQLLSNASTPTGFSQNGNNACSASNASNSSNGNVATNTGEVAPRVQCHINEVQKWGANEVCEFVGGIEICVEYVQNFREQNIDGEGLTMLTEEHLMKILGMKLGPALKLRAKLNKKLNAPCACGSCHTTTSETVVSESTSFITNFNKLIIPRTGSDPAS